MDITAQQIATAANVASLINNNVELKSEDSMNLYYSSLGILGTVDENYLSKLRLKVLSMTESPSNYTRTEICSSPDKCVYSLLEDIGLPIIKEKPESEVLKELKEQYNTDVARILEERSRYRSESSKPRIPSWFSYLLRYKCSRENLEDLICDKVRNDIINGSVTPEVFTLAMVNKNEDLDVGSTLYDAYNVVPFFVGFSRIIDNVLDKIDRQLFNLIESEYGYIVSSGSGEDTTLYDGREWRTHYWYVRTKKIIKNARECFERYAGSINTEEKVDSEEAKIGIKEKINQKDLTDLYLKQIPSEVWEPEIVGVTFKNPKIN
ncbi:MAG: hypothetical protein JSW73_00280 [Candidatus Woesearchaeota archaeon]|nr:MAG: hypothetical protein JSW73_00280 [Candidatus Woesearchaeota archaeon]